MILASSIGKVFSQGSLAISVDRRWVRGLAVLAVGFAFAWLSSCGGSEASLKCSGDAAVVDLGTGQVCADSGFRPAMNDFAFPNWGGLESGEEQVNSATLIALYGANQVCSSGTTAADCVLTPVAEESLGQLNTSLGGGRCEGLAVLSVRYHLGLDDPSAVESSASLTHDLVRPQSKLDSQIITWWSTQFAPEVLAKAAESREKDPAKLVVELAQGLANGGGYTIGIYGDGLGHAVTPFAVTQRDKQYVVHIYDNNYPGERREILVDPASKTWSYEGASENPDGSAGTWSGSTGTFEITPMDARVPPFTSPFTSKSESVKGSVKIRLAMSSAPGDPAAGLLVTTKSGKQFGIVNGQLVSGVAGGTYTVGKGGLGTSLTELEIPDLDEEYSVQPVAATSEGSTRPIEATLSVVSADGTSTSMRAEVSLAVATSTSETASLGSAMKISADAGVTVEARGAVSVVVATNQGKVEAELDAGQSLVMQSSTGLSEVKVVAEDGSVVSETKLTRVDSPPPEERTSTTSTTTTTRPPDVEPSIEALNLPNLTYGQANIPAIAAPTSNSGGRFTFSSSDPRVVSIDPTSGRITINGAGTTTVTATQDPSQGFLSGSISGRLVVQRADPGIDGISSSSRLLIDGAFGLIAPFSSGDGSVSWSSSDPSVAAVDSITGLVTPIAAGSTTITYSRDQSSNYFAGSVSATLTVQRAIPSFGFFTFNNRLLVDGSFTATAPSSTSTGAASWSSSNTAVATVDATSGVVTPVSVGATTITFSRAQSAAYVAGSVSATLAVQRATPSFGSFTLDSRLLVDGSFTATAPSSTSTGAASWSSSNTAVATVDATSGVVTPVSVGSTTITFARAQSEAYVAGSTTAELSIERATPTFGAFTLSDRFLVDGGFTASAPSSTSTGSVSWSSSDPAVAVVDSVTGVVTPIAAGSTTITFSRAQSADYVAGSVSATLAVQRATPSFGTFSSSTKYVSDTPFALTAPSSNSDGTASWSSSKTSVATINSVTGVVTPVSIGSTTITFARAQSASYKSGSITATLTITRAPDVAPSIAALVVPGATFGQAGAVTIAAPSSNSTGKFTFASSDSRVATINATTGLVTIISAGSTTITATQAAATGYLKGSVSAALTVERATPTFGSFLLNGVGIYERPSALVAPTSSGDGTVSWSSSDTSIATIDSVSGVVTPKALGSTTITFSRAQSANFAAGSTTATLTVTSLAVTTFDTLPAITVSDPKRVYIVTAAGPTQNTLRSDGLGSWWSFKKGSVGDVTGNFDVSIDLYIANGGGREIADFAFWMSGTGGSAKGYAYRLQNQGDDSGFFAVENGATSALEGGDTADVATSSETWYRISLKAVGDTVTATVTLRETGAVLSVKTMVLPTGNRAGVFGQQADAAGTAAGHRWDNFTLRPLS